MPSARSPAVLEACTASLEAGRFLLFWNTVSRTLELGIQVFWTVQEMEVFKHQKVFKTSFKQQT